MERDIHAEEKSVVSIRSAQLRLDRKRLRLRRDEQSMGMLGKFFGTAWTPAEQVTGIVLAVITVFLFATFLLSPTVYTDLQKALVALIASALAFIWGRRGR